jgi:hypothetical protein
MHMMSYGFILGAKVGLVCSFVLLVYISLVRNNKKD